jgi:AcrR family transcriptional regulator
MRPAAAFAVHIHVNLAHVKTRPYQMTARADATAATGERIVAAAHHRFVELDYEDVTLDSIAVDAGVTVQTVLRRFGSKEGLARAIKELQTSQIVNQRDTAPAGDIPAAIRVLVEHFEQTGNNALHLLRQAHRVAPFAEITGFGRANRAQWVERVFAPWLTLHRGAARARLRAQLISTCDVQTWNLLRHLHGLSRRQTELALIELVEGVLR